MSVIFYFVCKYRGLSPINTLVRLKSPEWWIHNSRTVLSLLSWMFLVLHYSCSRTIPSPLEGIRTSSDKNDYCLYSV